MKRVHAIYVFIGLLVVSAIIGFKKNDSKDLTVNVENVAGSYKLTEVTSQEKGEVERSIYNLYLNDCETDDVLQLNADLTSTHIDQGKTCTPAGLESGMWSLPANNKIEIEGTLCTIAKFEANNLKVVFADTNVSLHSTITLTYTRL
jgi:hypothetical protein